MIKIIMSENSKINQWMLHKSEAVERAFYSIKRIDVLIVTISGACIYIVFEILRFIHSPECDIVNSNTDILKTSAIFSVLAISSNFASQITGLYTNNYEVEYTSHKINLIEKKQKDDKILIKIDKKVKRFDNWTRILNISSALCMAFGIVLLVIYNLITF